MFQSASNACAYVNHLIDKRVKLTKKRWCRACTSEITEELKPHSSHVDGNLKLCSIDRLLDSALSGSTVIELPTLTHFLCVPFVPILFTLVSLIAIVLLFLVLLLSAFSVISASFCVHLLLPCRHVAPGLFESAVCRAVFLCSQFSTSGATTTNQLIVYCKNLWHCLTQPDQALQKERKIGEERLDSQQVLTMRPY